MVTPTYTVVLLQIAIMLDSRAKPASPLFEWRNVPLATAIQTPTPVADKNRVASKPTNTPTGPHKANMVTQTYTNLLLQLAIRLDPRAKPASPLCEQRNVPLATAIRCLTPVADKNRVAKADQHADRTAQGKDGDTTDRDQHTEGIPNQIPVPPLAPRLVQAPAERSQSSNSAEGYAEKETEGKKLRSTREVAIAFSTSVTPPSAAPSGSYKNFKDRLVD